MLILNCKKNENKSATLCFRKKKKKDRMFRHRHAAEDLNMRLGATNGYSPNPYSIVTFCLIYDE